MSSKVFEPLVSTALEYSIWLKFSPGVPHWLWNWNVDYIYRASFEVGYAEGDGSRLWSSTSRALTLKAWGRETGITNCREDTGYRIMRNSMSTYLLQSCLQNGRSRGRVSWTNGNNGKISANIFVFYTAISNIWFFERYATVFVACTSVFMLSPSLGSPVRFSTEIM